MAEAQIRQTAYKALIADLVNGVYINPEGEWVPSYVQVKDKKVSRVNIIANSIAKFQNEEGTYISLTIDDGSDNITLKVWNEDTKILENINIEDLKERVIKSDELLNTNKEFVVEDFKTDNNEFVIKTAYKEDYVGKSKTVTLKERLGFSEIRDVKKSIIWQIKIDEDDKKKREEIYKKVLDTNIFYNPYSQDCKLYN